MGPGRLIIQLSAWYFQGGSSALRTFLARAAKSRATGLRHARTSVRAALRLCACGLCCAPKHSPSRMDPAPQRCKGCRKVFPNKDKLHGPMGRSACCLEACVSGSAGASAGGIANDSDSEVAMTATEAARFGDAGVRPNVCEALAALRFSGRTPVSESAIQVVKDVMKDWLQMTRRQALSRAVGAASAARPCGS